MALIHTCPDLPDQSQVDLLTPSHGTRSLVRTLDTTLVDNVSSVPGSTLTAALNALLAAIPAQGVVVSQSGWATNTNSNVLQLQPAGHAAGMYEICLTIIVRTLSAGQAAPVVSWTSPVFGAETNKVLGSGMDLIPVGTSRTVSGSSNVPLRSMPIMSTGATAITLQIPTTTQAGLADIYAMARLIGV